MATTLPQVRSKKKWMRNLRTTTSFLNCTLYFLNLRYSTPPHHQVQILTSSLTPTLHKTKVWCVPTHQLNKLLQSKCGGPRGQFVGLHPNTQTDETNITLASALLRLKVHMRAWSATRILSWQRARRRILHRVLLRNWPTMSKYSTPDQSRWKCTRRRIPEMQKNDVYHVYNWRWTACK